MKIGILGSGDVGRRLGNGFVELGHTVKIGSRNPHQEKITEWMAKHDKQKYHQELLQKQLHLAN
jgi:8-hydroxy-5-deazaflavin:NADPH oxidoreductase